MFRIHKCQCTVICRSSRGEVGAQTRAWLEASCKVTLHHMHVTRHTAFSIERANSEPFISDEVTGT
jgi:hypothetical protein